MIYDQPREQPQKISWNEKPPRMLAFQTTDGGTGNVQICKAEAGPNNPPGRQPEAEAFETHHKSL
jgi:hypothetical protein